MSKKLFPFKTVCRFKDFLFNHRPEQRNKNIISEHPLFCWRPAAPEVRTPSPPVREGLLFSGAEIPNISGACGADMAIPLFAKIYIIFANRGTGGPDTPPVREKYISFANRESWPRPPSPKREPCSRTGVCGCSLTS